MPPKKIGRPELTEDQKVKGHTITFMDSQWNKLVQKSKAAGAKSVSAFIIQEFNL